MGAAAIASVVQGCAASPAPPEKSPGRSRARILRLPSRGAAHPRARAAATASGDVKATAPDVQFLCMNGPSPTISVRHAALMRNNGAGTEEYECVMHRL